MLAMSTGAKSEFLQAARGYLAAAGSPTPEANIENVNGRGRLSGLRPTEADVYIFGGVCTAKDTDDGRAAASVADGASQLRESAGGCGVVLLDLLLKSAGRPSEGHQWNQLNREKKKVDWKAFPSQQVLMVLC